MQVTFENISSQSHDEFSELLANSSENAFDYAFSIFWGDLKFTSDRISYTLPNVAFLSLANMLFIRCFKVNFSPRTEGIIRMDVGDGNAQINYKYDGQKVWFELVSSSRKTLLVNGQEVASGRSAELEMSLYEFNQMCGEIKRQSIRFLVDAFEGIDGVEEYFNVLHFSEGFFEEWPLN